MCMLPTFTKCCFCFPLREGVLCYGYIHLIFCSLGTVYVVGSGLLKEPVIQIASAICAGLLMIDALFLIILIIACHKKQIGLLKPPLVYNKVWWVLYVVLFGFIAIRMVVMYKEAIATDNGLILLVLFHIGLYILPGLICNICLRTYVILWIKGLMTQLKEQSPSFDIATDTAHILEATEENEEMIQIQIVEGVIQLEDTDKEPNIEKGIEVQINEDKNETKENDNKSIPDNQVEVRVLTFLKDNSVQNTETEQAIELQVFNSTNN